MYTKKLVSLILVVAMMLSVFAVTASAAEVVEPASPRYNSMCPNCDTAGWVGAAYYELYRIASTNLVGHPHDHYYMRLCYENICDYCGYREYSRTNQIGEFCQMPTSGYQQPIQWFPPSGVPEN